MGGVRVVVRSSFPSATIIVYHQAIINNRTLATTETISLKIAKWSEMKWDSMTLCWPSGRDIVRILETLPYESLRNIHILRREGVVGTLWSIGIASQRSSGTTNVWLPTVSRTEIERDFSLCRNSCISWVEMNRAWTWTAPHNIKGAKERIQHLSVFSQSVSNRLFT